MTTLKRLGPIVVLGTVITLFAGAAALATPPTDAEVTPLARGSLGQLDVQHDGVQVTTENTNADVAVAEVTIGPGGSTGWHHHPGVTLVSVASGTVTEYHEDCDKTVLKAGDGFSEGTDKTHVVQNEGNAEAVLYVTFIVPSGTSAEGLRIDDPQPENCDTQAAAAATATASPTATATATTTASPTATATASPTATATALPGSGGPALVLPVTSVASLALMASGVGALLLVRRRVS
jgi:quercetin dioxygenase-like cupin family protein